MLWEMEGGNSEPFILTKAALAKKNSGSDFQCVVYESHKRKDSDKKQNLEDRKKRSAREDEMDMKKVRWEVFKFGMSGLKRNEHAEAKVALAVSLGAKPPKKSYVNYKELKEEKKKKFNEKRDEEMSGADVHKKKKPSRPESQLRRKSDVLELYGRVGEGKRKKKKRRM